MILSKTKAAGLGLALLAGVALTGATPAAAQLSSYSEDSGTALTRHLKSLSDNPRGLSALMGAGKAALDLGDPQAAVTFFARAEEVAPRDPRIKAGMASAFVQMEQAQSALKFFSDAAGLGIAESEIAADRGLAYDLTGDTKRAQADYQLALRSKEDPEVRRRLALSLAISGDKAGALAALDGQLQRQDRAAWRTRAFVLALAGDSAAATQAMQAVMPTQAAAMQPFLARLPSLDPAGRAMAVHFGHMPGSGQTAQVAQPTQYAGLDRGAVTQAGRPDGGQAGLGVRTPPPEPISAAPRRRPGADETATTTSSRSAAAEAPRRRRESGMPLMAPTPQRRERRVETREVETKRAEVAPVRIAATIPAPRVSAPEPSSPALVTPPPANMQTSALAISPPLREQLGPPAPEASASPPPVALFDPAPAPVTESPAVATVALPESSVLAPLPAAAEAAPKEETSAPAPVPAASTPKPSRPLAFADVAEAIRALPETQTRAPARLAALTSVPKPKPAAPVPSAAAGTDAAKARHWVQIASAPDSLVASEYRRLKAKHGRLLGDSEGYRTPMGKSNRVLVGPFASAGEARDFVGELKKSSLTAIAWTSPDGQEIEKLSAK